MCGRCLLWATPSFESTVLASTDSRQRESGSFLPPVGTGGRLHTAALVTGTPGLVYRTGLGELLLDWAEAATHLSGYTAWTILACRRSIGALMFWQCK